MKRQTAIRNLLLVALTAVVGTGAGCPFLTTPSPLPFGQITAVQIFDEQDFTVAFSVESAVFSPASIAQVNWVFGDGTGFVEGPADRATISHIYTAPGTFEVTAFIFDANGFVDQLSSIVNVLPGNGNNPGPNPGPDGDLPTMASGPIPANGATDVDVDADLSWISGLDTDSHDVYFGTDEVAVTDADTDDAGVFRGNQTETSLELEALLPETEYFWRVDEVNAVGTTKGDIFSFTTGTLPSAITNASPANGATMTPITTLLSWTAGDDATSHDVYFGKNMMAVADADEDSDEFQGNQTGTTFNPEDEDADDDGLLLAATTYYWRIDEVGPGGTSTGIVRSFTTAPAPVKVMMPAPTDGATNINVNQVLSWTAAPSIQSFDVYFGTDPIEVAAAEDSSATFRGNQTGTTFDPANVLGDTEYFWRIDTLGPGGTTTGDVFSFTTNMAPGQVVGPFTPAQNATTVDIETDLVWSAGGGTITTYTIYLDTNVNAVTNGLASALLQTQDAGSTMVERESEDALAPDTTFFWRVDANGPGGTTAGPVLSFTTGSVPAIVEVPNPAIGELGVMLSPTLSWMASAGATDYDVYLGTNQTNVANAGQQNTQFRGTVNTTMFMPATLLGNTQYFWRIDAKGPGGVATGTVWNFTTAPARATAPMPANNALNVALDVELSWTAGAGATSHDVYLGTDMMAVTNATDADAEFQINQTDVRFMPMDDLAGNTQYFWRIDEVNDDGVTKGNIWRFTTGAGQATEVSPTDGATLTALMPTLEWLAGEGAAMHDIYLGTDETAVMNATRGSAEFQATQALGDEDFIVPVRLPGSTTHFWRIDSVTATGTTQGEVWQFRTKPGRATAPEPTNFATDILVTTLLMWTGDAEALRFEIFFGENEFNVSTAEVGSLPVGVTLIDAEETTADTPTLNSGTNYFWRVDTVAGDDTTRTRGLVWRFTTRTADVPGQASGPSPLNGAINVNVDMNLTWSSATNADSYDVYFGTDQTAVTNATDADPQFQGNQPGVSFDPGTMAEDTTYYWRIDTVNDNGTTTGVVWSFTTELP